MLAEVRRNVTMLEKVFLMEEDSDAEEDEKILADIKFDASLQEQEEEELKVSYIDKRQFWCVPILVDVNTYDFENLGKV